MCMILKNGKIDKNHGKVNSDGCLVGYKVIYNNDHSLLYGWDKKWEEGLNRSNRRTTSFLNYEEHNGPVYKGFHIYLSKKATKIYRERQKKDNSKNVRKNKGLKVIKVYYKPTDIVSYGYTKINEYKIRDGRMVDCSTKHLKTVVITKCMVKSLKGI